MTGSEPREVYSAADTQEAHFIKAALEDAGIAARVVGDYLQNAVGDLSAVAIAPCVWVQSEDFDEARKIIADLQAGATPANEWKCAECGEPNEPSFEICWNCQAVHDGE
ncbi:MAG: DUF2007 domain-containing protein [Planctomycetaceae bacterium]|nr:DUF2007 domain-containing protein [Planctomycetaceae bacterium]MBT6158268.1 DUF2007 domain-containing protein [Planctomycetaceae bacterium]MBT6483948.1 DUF2007 domain-containing protein [Planctomycetaceae bacterium]MBT6493981.1 DUF2007 domain-containing protein [Planctomycetaceae bacterium]